MKKIFALFTGAGLMALAHSSPVPSNTSELSREIARSVYSSIQVANQLNWRVGEYHNFELKMAFGSGNGTKTVTQDVPAQGAFWYVTEMNILGQTQKTEALMRRSDGEVLKLIVNGREQDPGSDSKIEIIEQSETSVTVPAGTFDCFYVKARVTSGGQTQDVEAWINPVDVNLDGTLKMVIQSGFGPITMSLKQFGSK